MLILYCYQTTHIPWRLSLSGKSVQTGKTFSKENLSANLRKREDLELGETLLFYCLVEYHFAEHKTFQLLTKLRSAIKT